MISTFNIADHVLAFSIEKEIDEDLMQKLEEMAEERLESHKTLNIYREAEKGMTVFAVLKDINFHLKFKDRDPKRRS